MSLRINDTAPNFKAKTTQGSIDFHEWIGNRWVILFSHPVGIRGDTHLTAVDILDRESQKNCREDCGGLFVFIGADAETTWLPAEIARDGHGYIPTGDDAVKSGRWSHNRDPYLLESSAPGIFACGDVRLSPVKRVASAVGEGSMAIAFVHQYLQREGRSRSQ
ncbi:MAG TPA: hypothetical protein VKP66_01190 [Steroidobacteraceae bacterium]|nr:hypothetical protein [Steroidobacteraceae bacterium]